MIKISKIFTWYALWVICLFYRCESRSLSEVPKWGIFESDIKTHIIYENPFSDVELVVKYTRPDSSIINFRGFYDGENTWKFRIMPDMQGIWRYEAFFSDSSRLIAGKFMCIPSDKPGPLTVLESDPIWLVYKDAKPKQIRSFHVGDRFFASNFDSLEPVEFLDWICDYDYNMLSIASHYLNRQQDGRGRGWDTPKLWPLNPVEYQNLELHLNELERRRIVVFPFAGFFGRAADWPVNHEEQEVYIKYIMARLAPYWNIILNVARPEPLLRPEDYQGGHVTYEDISRLAKVIKNHDPYNHPLSVHNRTRNAQKEYERDPFIFEPWEDYTVLQGGKSADLQEVYDFVMASRKVVKPIYAQEVLWYGNMYHAELDLEQLRKKAITLIMAGSFVNFGDMNGNSSSGFSGCLRVDSAHEAAHKVIQNVWDLFDSFPFHELTPKPDLVDSAFCLSDGYGKFLIYNPSGKVFTFRGNERFSGFWINPKNINDKIVLDAVSLNSSLKPPNEQDWFLWIEAS